MRHEPTLDAKIAALTPDVGPLRDEMQGALSTLRAADNPKGAIIQTSSIALQLIRDLLERAGRTPPSDNLFSCSSYAVKEGLLPAEIDSYLQNPRFLSNKADHARLSIAITTHDAEILLSQLLRFGEWLYCNSEHGPRLATIYGAFAEPVAIAAYQSPALPTPALPLVGRAAELESWHQSLRGEMPRVLTLTGIGGIGKSRAALELARRCAADAMQFPGGVAWIELAEIGTGEEMAQRMVYALNFGFQPPPTAHDQLVNFLRERQMLLVLDNTEQIAEAAEEISTLLHASPRLKVLVTSRRALGLMAEQVREVEPLPITDAEQLFETMARARRPNFALHEGNAAAVAELCRRLEGVPLAIVLAASRIGMGVPRILELLAEHFLDLASNASDLSPRQRALRATMDWSYALLTPDSQFLFAQLSVFAGGFTYDDATAICDSPDIWEGLEDLQRDSLLRAGFDAAAGQDRLLMLESLREYAAEKLATFGEAETRTRQSHAEYFLSFAEERISRVRKPDEAVALRELEAAIGNLRAALQWCDETQALEWQGRLALAQGRFLLRRGALNEAVRLIDGGLETVRRLPGELSTLGAALSLERAGLHFDQREWPPARAGALAALAIFETTSDIAGRAEAHNLLGLIARRERDFAAARQQCDLALAAFRQANDRSGEAIALNNRGSVELQASTSALLATPAIR